MINKAELDQTATGSIPDNWFNAQSQPKAADKSSALITIPTELQQILAQAQLDNLSIKMAVARLDIAQTVLQINYASLLPKIDATLATQRNQQLVTEQKSLKTSHSANFRASWELDIWRKLANNQAAAEAEYLSSKFELNAAKQSIFSQILTRYLDIQETQELIYWSKQNLTSQQRRVNITAQRLDSGLSNSQDYRLALNSLYSIQATLSQQKLSLHQAQQRFNLLLGRYPSTPIDPIQAEIKLPSVIKLISPQQVLRQRPDLVSSEYSLLSAHYRTVEAHKGYLPDIKLGASFRATREDFSQLFDWKYWLANLTADLVQPIFNSGAISAKMAQQKARQDLTLAQYQQTLLSAWQEIEQALFAEQELRIRFSALEQAYEQIAAAEQRTIINYQNGLASSFELLNLQTRRINAKVNLIRSRFAILSNRINLILALGEPFPATSLTSETS
ncbi:TolC family protein [Paraglaciecola aquimarina]|uniref:TolC family protein n=1 Tax=Paraglaciecola algarum TaxID=3050085 RepID=A0ABS9DAE0_9ALTE|nr:TolC family protein [Paraglaciecola sp. G1-23]MCF2949350.1 TolC family protein [Paraglaciecola sp. G1-23]